MDREARVWITLCRVEVTLQLLVTSFVGEHVAGRRESVQMPAKSCGGLKLAEAAVASESGDRQDSDHKSDVPLTLMSDGEGRSNRERPRSGRIGRMSRERVAYYC